MIFHGSATLFFVASGVSIPLVSLVSAAPFMGPLREEFHWFDVLVVTVTVLGLLIYRIKPELPVDLISADQLKEVPSSPTEGKSSSSDAPVRQIRSFSSATPTSYGQLSSPFLASTTVYLSDGDNDEDEEPTKRFGRPLLGANQIQGHQ